MEAEKIAGMDDAQLAESIQKGLGEEGEPLAPETPQLAEGVEEPTQPEAPPAEPPPPTLEERLAKLEAQIAEKERFIQRQGNEIGQLRKQVSRPQIDLAKAREEINQQYQTDPMGATLKAQALQRHIWDVAREQRQAIVPDLPDLLDDICEIAKGEGESDQTLAAFRQDPWRVPDPILYDYAVRARAYRYLKTHTSESQTLKAEVERLRKGATEQVAAKIDQAAKASPVIRASSGGGTSSEKDARTASRLSAEQIPNLSDAELKALLSKRKTL